MKEKLDDGKKSKSSHTEGNHWSDSKKSKPFQVKVRLVGWHKSLPPAKYPPDDSNVSPGHTPEDRGGRGCRYCGSRKHWDNHCKYAEKEGRNVRARLANIEDEDQQAEQEYEDLYNESNPSVSEEDESEEEEEEESDSEKEPRTASARVGCAKLGGSLIEDFASMKTFLRSETRSSPTAPIAVFIRAH